MSKPNLLGFRTSIGFYRNRRVRECRENLGRIIRRKVPFCDLTPTLFQALMAYAAENQTNGDFAGYTQQRWTEIFASNNIAVTPAEAALIKKEFQRTGLLDGDKIRSWAMFNREFALYATLTKSRQRAAKIMHKKRELEARALLKSGHGDTSNPAKNGHEEREKTAPKPVQKSPQKDSDSKRLWVLDQALLQARGKARKELLRQREELLSESTGVDLTQPSPSSPTPSAPDAPKKSEKQRQAEWRRGQVTAAKKLIEDGASEILTESMVRALIDDGYNVPAEVQSRFPKLFKNPVPE